jgi:hypothetical protein
MAEKADPLFSRSSASNRNQFFSKIEPDGFVRYRSYAKGYRQSPSPKAPPKVLLCFRIGCLLGCTDARLSDEMNQRPDPATTRHADV